LTSATQAGWPSPAAPRIPLDLHVCYRKLSYV